jgi:hypothetical protein
MVSVDKCGWVGAVADPVSSIKELLGHELADRVFARISGCERRLGQTQHAEQYREISAFVHYAGPVDFDATGTFSHADVGACRGHAALKFQNGLTSSKKEL